MSFVQDFKDVLLSPKEFFEGKDAQNFRDPFKFALTALTLSAVISVAQFFVGGGGNYLTALVGTQGTITAAIALGLTTLLFGVFGLFINSSIDHIFVSLLGDDRYKNTFCAFAYSTAVGVISSLVGLLFAAIPVSGNLIGLISGLITFGLLLYTLYVISRGLSVLSNLSFGESVLAVAIPILILLVIIAGVYFISASMMQQQLGSLQSAPSVPTS